MEEIRIDLTGGSEPGRRFLLDSIICKIRDDLVDIGYIHASHARSVLLVTIRDFDDRKAITRATCAGHICEGMQEKSPVPGHRGSPEGREGP